jgi:hypothetical protein
VPPLGEGELRPGRQGIAAVFNVADSPSVMLPVELDYTQSGLAMRRLRRLIIERLDGPDLSAERRCELEMWLEETDRDERRIVRALALLADICGAG